MKACNLFSGPKTISACRKIAGAVVTQAVVDARAGNQEALNWFFTQDAENYLSILEIDPEKVISMARAGFPKDPKAMKPNQKIDFQMMMELR
jgi:hypothetical protein